MFDIRRRHAAGWPAQLGAHRSSPALLVFVGCIRPASQGMYASVKDHDQRLMLMKTWMARSDWNNQSTLHQQQALGTPSHSSLLHRA